MYSLSTCGNCRLTAEELKKEGIVFTEKFIDTQRGVREELNDKTTRWLCSPSVWHADIAWEWTHDDGCPLNQCGQKSHEGMSGLSRHD
jgi:hypothetical protein